MAILVQQSEATAALRRMYFHCVDATDGMTPETGEAAGQSQISLNGAAWGNTTNTLTAIGNGRYYVELIAATEANSLGIIEGRYKSANTAESIGTTLQVVPFDPYDGVRAGLTALPNAAADAAGGLPVSDAGGLDLDAKLASTNEVTAVRMGALTDWINAGRLDVILDAIKAKTDNLPAAPANDTDIDTQLAAIEAFLNPEIANILTHTTALNALIADSKIAAQVKGMDADVLTASALATDAGDEIADQVADEVYEGTLTLRHISRILLAVLAGKSSGGGTATIKFRDNADGKDRVTATVEADGDRTAMTLDGT